MWIGCGSIILPGVTIGDNSIIGAGSVVTRSIPANCKAMGVPARVTGAISSTACTSERKVETVDAKTGSLTFNKNQNKSENETDT